MKLQFHVLLFVIQSAGAFVYGQAPNAFKYQAVIRDAGGATINNQIVSFRATIRRNSATGPIVYQELSNPSTNNFGLIVRNIGEINLLGFAAIDWDNGPFFLETEIDPNGGSSFTISGTSELLSVPFALYTNEAAFADTSSYARLSHNSIFSDTSAFSIRTDSALYANHAESSVYSDTTWFSFQADSANHAIYADTAFFAYFADTANFSNFSDTTIFANRSDSSVYADTAGYAPSTGWQGYAILTEQYPSGTYGHNSAAASWNTRNLNTTEAIGGNSILLVGDSIRLSVGTYYVRAVGGIYESAKENRLRIYNLNANTIEILGISSIVRNPNRSEFTHLEGVLNVTTPNSYYQLQHYTTDNRIWAFGWPTNIPGVPEVYATLFIQKID